jgi:hypothetical protein
VFYMLSFLSDLAFSVVGSDALALHLLATITTVDIVYKDSISNKGKGKD